MRRIYLELSKRADVVELGPFWSRWLKVFASNKVSLPVSVKVGDSWFNCMAELIKSKGSWQALLDWGEEIKNSSSINCGLGLLKPFYMELVVRGLSESIVDELLIVEADHSVGKLNSNLQKRWKTIALEHSAIKGRLLPLSLKFVDCWERLFSDWIFESVIALDKSGVPLSKVEMKNACCFLVGPEGGFSMEEVDYFLTKNVSVISLGDEIFSSWFSAVSFASFLTLKQL